MTAFNTKDLFRVAPTVTFYVEGDESDELFFIHKRDEGDYPTNVTVEVKPGVFRQQPGEVVRVWNLHFDVLEWEERLVIRHQDVELQDARTCVVLSEQVGDWGGKKCHIVFSRPMTIEDFAVLLKTQ